MATDKIGFPSYDSYVAFAEEATFGTAIADGSNFNIIKLVDNNVPGFVPEQYLDDTIKNEQKNIADENNYYKDEGGLWQRYQIPNFYADSGTLAHMLYAVTQTVSEAADGAYLKTYTMNGATKPDFSSNAGYFFTLLVEEPMASFAKKLTSCVVDNLTISISPDNGGRAIASASVITGKGYLGTSNPSGTNAYPTNAVVDFFNATSTLTINSLDCVFYNVTFNIQTMYDFTGHTGNYAENYTIVGQKVTGTTTVKFDANTDVFSNSKGTNVGAFDFDIGSSDTEGFFAFDSGDAFLRNVSYDRGGTDSVQKLILEWDFPNDYSASSYSVFRVADGTDRSW